jgi:HSP20 family protein
MTETATVTKRSEESIAIKQVRPGSLVEKVNNIFDRIARRSFEIFEANGQTSGHDLENWFKAEGELLHPVHLNMSETDESVIVQAEVPGFAGRDLEVSIEPRRLTITGKRETSKEEKKGKTVYTETCCDELLRIVELPAEVDVDKATTTLNEGVLGLTIPKVAKARTVPILTKSAA